MGVFSDFPTCHWANSEFASKTALVWQAAENAPAFLHQFPTQLNWQQLDQLLDQIIVLFRQSGVQTNQLLAYQGQVKFLAMLSYLAALKMGCRILMLNAALTSAQTAELLKSNQVDFLILDQLFANFSPKLTACGELPSPDFHAAATLTLTSGSSGFPKSVVHSIQNHLDNAKAVCELMEFSSQHSWLLSLPLFHVSGQAIIWRWLSVGARLHIDDNKATFWQTLSQVSHSSLVPTQLQRYINWLPAESQLSQRILLGGAFIPPKLVEDANNRNIVTFSGYGMTEMASTVSAASNALHSVGKPLASREVKIVQSEIWVKGAGLALGYWQKGEIISLVNSQGYFQTKDCGSFDADGNLYVQGRLDNMFISGGENIQPEDVEKVLISSNLLKNCVVVPCVDEEFGERPLAFVEFEQLYSPQAVGLLQDFAKQHLEKFKQPTDYLPLESEKWQSSGIKVSRAALKQYAAAYKAGKGYDI